MGKNLIQQKRGKGSTTYRSPSFRFKGKTSMGEINKDTVQGKVADLIDCPGHTAPLMEVQFDNSKVLMQAPEGIKIGDKIESGDETEILPGNIVSLKNIPEGTSVYNIENIPGDGGKFVRSSGGNARVVAKLKDRVVVMLPSKKERSFKPECRATIGTVAGAGRTEKPFLKAGIRYHAMRAKNKLYPKTAALAMNAVDHPFGGSSTCSKGVPSTVSRDAPPGRKVGKIAARRTGRRKGK